MVEPFLGMIQYFAFDYAPRGWSLCTGQTLPLTQYQALFALLGNMYGGDGRTNFQLPDLQGRAVIGYGAGANLMPYNLATKGGTESITLTLADLPSHTHTVGTVHIGASNQYGNAAMSCVNTFMAKPDTGSDPIYATAPTTNDFMGASTITVSAAGGSAPMPVVNPYIALTCCIAMVGIFPSRN